MARGRQLQRRALADVSNTANHCSPKSDPNGHPSVPSAKTASQRDNASSQQQQISHEQQELISHPNEPHQQFDQQQQQQQQQQHRQQDHHALANGGKRRRSPAASGERVTRSRKRAASHAPPSNDGPITRRSAKAKEKSRKEKEEKASDEDPSFHRAASAAAAGASSAAAAAAAAAVAAAAAAAAAPPPPPPTAPPPTGTGSHLPAPTREAVLRRQLHELLEVDAGAAAQPLPLEELPRPDASGQPKKHREEELLSARAASVAHALGLGHSMQLVEKENLIPFGHSGGRRHTERRVMPKNYLSPGSAFTVQMRAAGVAYAQTIQSQLRLSDETLHLCIRFTDRFLEVRRRRPFFRARGRSRAPVLPAPASAITDHPPPLHTHTNTHTHTHLLTPPR